MRSVRLGLIIAVGVASVCHAQQAKNGFDSTYGLLSERNMFSRERHKPRPANDRRNDRPPVDTTSPQAVERAFVLRGVAIEDEVLHAYLENTRTNAVVRVVPGDTLASGTVSGIAIDAIEYAADGRRAWIEVGQNLSGVRAAPTTAPSLSSPTDSTSAPLPPGGGTLEERMKQRRLQQRGGR